MKKVLSVLLLGILFTLTGCIGEDYDFTPPSVTLFESDITLKEANIDWNSDKQYQKETKDILQLAKKQTQKSVSPNEKDLIIFDSEDFRVDELTIHLWSEGEKSKIELDKNRYFHFPKEKGEYLIEVDLLTDKGTAEYVGNVVVE
ncbi:hypothetical protein G3A_17420 [Bacillus sp. 17376]|uniref:Lipoprotein n=1 Tax=Mesobacillus boroniphilus JCM 21738 TaxID=1294265 RepID=W4RUR7_9BACI|nr:hypothetical protein [Mesobacillus boroniphilus]ESU31308.1 hypothetical protein G3A_17420 [Bacillus sp. 17376]GAE48041.1 hypothetical protein JCM21738_5114 [Mesobacillus boroniphilus JCM 21738]